MHVMKVVQMNMTETKIQQYKYENDMWKRLLAFIQAENVILKTRLAQIASEEMDSDMLEEAEYFQNNFVGEDESINQLRNHVSEQGNLLSREVFEDGAILKEAMRQQRKIRKEVEQAEQRFNKLKFEFNNFFSESL
jgi:hypothetical protein